MCWYEEWGRLCEKDKQQKLREKDKKLNGSKEGFAEEHEHTLAHTLSD